MIARLVDALSNGVAWVITTPLFWGLEHADPDGLWFRECHGRRRRNMSAATTPARKTDTTGWCERGTHAGCDGTLRTATGYHWWCVCECHPEPTPPVLGGESDKALAVWHMSRASSEDMR